MRANTHASGNPSTNAIIVANTEVINDSRSASDAGPLVTEPKMPDQATRLSSPIRGNNKNNKTIPKNLEKKQYDESYEELKNSIKNANEKGSC